MGFWVQNQKGINGTLVLMISCLFVCLPASCMSTVIVGLFEFLQMIKQKCQNQS